MDYKAARLAMIESQLRPNGVRDPALLNAFASIAREEFVPKKVKPLAYIDESLLVASAADGNPPRYLLPPMVLGRMLQFAAPHASDKVLDVGGATGYSAAILSKVCGKVDAIETSGDMAEMMTACLKSAGIGSVTVHSGPLPQGLPSAAPFTIILLNGGIHGEPRELFAQLAEGGRLVAVLRKGWMGQAWIYTKSGDSVSGKAIFDAGAEVIAGFEAKPQFAF